MAKVTITTAGHSIELDEDDATAEDLGKLALVLWLATRDPKLDRVEVVGFVQAERAEPFYGPGYAGEWPDEERHRGHPLA